MSSTSSGLNHMNDLRCSLTQQTVTPLETKTEKEIPKPDNSLLQLLPLSKHTEFDQKLGEGSHGQVWSLKNAVDPQESKRWVVKLSKFYSERSRDTFRRECYFLEYLRKHRLVPLLLHSRIEHGFGIQIIQRFDGTLKSLGRKQAIEGKIKGKKSLVFTSKQFAQMVRLTTTLDSLQIVHGDTKPANILFRYYPLNQQNQQNQQQKQEVQKTLLPSCMNKEKQENLVSDRPTCISFSSSSSSNSPTFDNNNNNDNDNDKNNKNNKNENRNFISTETVEMKFSDFGFAGHYGADTKKQLLNFQPLLGFSGKFSQYKEIEKVDAGIPDVITHSNSHTNSHNNTINSTFKLKHNYPPSLLKRINSIQLYIAFQKCYRIYLRNHEGKYIRLNREQLQSIFQFTSEDITAIKKFYTKLSQSDNLLIKCLSSLWIF
jgi:serine/threonine protein kinase